MRIELRQSLSGEWSWVVYGMSISPKTNRVKWARLSDGHGYHFAAEAAEAAENSGVFCLNYNKAASNGNQ